MIFKPPAPTYLGPVRWYGNSNNKPILRIVMHGTVTPCDYGWARKVVGIWQRTSSPSSAHYVVDPGEVVQAVYDSVVAYHDGVNVHEIGVELCDWVGGGAGRSTPLSIKRWNTKKHSLMLQRAAELVAQLSLAYDVEPVMIGVRKVKAGKSGICEHSDVSKAFRKSTHWDLGNFPRRRFGHMVRAEVSALRGDTAAAKKHDKKAGARITKALDLLHAALEYAKAPRRKRLLGEAIDTLNQLGE